MARRLSDGELLWSRDTVRPPNDLPAVGRLFNKTRLSVVQPVGQQCVPGMRMDVHAFDAETGEMQWTFEGPILKTPMVAGDLEGYITGARGRTGIQPVTMPNPWGSPSIDADGTVWVGSETGHYFALRDLDGDGRVSGDKEAAMYDMQAAFVGSAGPSFAPGLMAIGSIGSLYVWK